MGVLFAQPAPATAPAGANFAPEHWATQEFARTQRDRPLICGVVYQDHDGDGLCRATPPYQAGGVGEGTGGITVTLSHPQTGFTLSTQTTTHGYYAFETFVDTTFVITIEGQSATVDVQGQSVKVDHVSGAIRTY